MKFKPNTQPPRLSAKSLVKPRCHKVSTERFTGKELFWIQSSVQVKAQCPEIGRVSVGSGHWSTCCPPDSSFQKVYRLALSPQLAQKERRGANAPGVGAGGYTFPHPALPPPPGPAQDESGRARGSPPASQLYLLLAGNGASAAPRLHAGPKDPVGASKGISPHHFSRGPGGRRACSSEGVVRRGRRGGRGGPLPHIPARPPRPPAREGTSRPRPPSSLRPPPPPVPEPRAAARGRGSLGAGAPRWRPARPRKGQRVAGGPCLHRQVPRFRPGPRIPSLRSRPGSCLPACLAGPTAPGSEPWRPGRPLPGTGRPGRGDPRGRRGPRAARSPGAAGAAGQARVRLRRGPAGV